MKTFYIAAFLLFTLVSFSLQQSPPTILVRDVPFATSVKGASVGASALSFPVDNNWAVSDIQGYDACFQFAIPITFSQSAASDIVLRMHLFNLSATSVVITVAKHKACFCMNQLNETFGGNFTGNYMSVTNPGGGLIPFVLTLTVVNTRLVVDNNNIPIVYRIGLIDTYNTFQSYTPTYTIDPSALFFYYRLRTIGGEAFRSTASKPVRLFFEYKNQTNLSCATKASATPSTLITFNQTVFPWYVANLSSAFQTVNSSQAVRLVRMQIFTAWNTIDDQPSILEIGVCATDTCTFESVTTAPITTAMVNSGLFVIPITSHGDCNKCNQICNIMCLVIFLILFVW